MGHIHAELMAQYAEDVKQYDRPWELWQHGDHEVWVRCTTHPSWFTDHSYRRKPKTILINGHEVPEPHRTPLEIGDAYWTFTFFFAGVIEVYWDGDSEDHNAFKNGFIHLTKEAAEKHLAALKSFTAKGEQ